MTYVLVVVPLFIIAAVLYIGIRIPADSLRRQAVSEGATFFRLIVVLTFLLSGAVLRFVPPSAFETVIPLLLLTAIGMGAWVLQYRRFKPSMDQNGRPMQVVLSDWPDRIPLYLWLSVISFLVILAAAVYLHVNWDRIPVRLPAHWRFDGQADRWNERSVQGVYGQLIFGTLLNGWLFVLALSLWHGVRRSAYRSAVVQVLIAAQCAVSLSVCVATFLQVWDLDRTIGLTIILISWTCIIAFAFRTVLRVYTAPSSGWDDAAQTAWVGDTFYFNREDPALAVPRRNGFGYTFNFARLDAWILLASPFVIVFASVRWLF
jgi:uncharacterized membrane protein